MKCKTERSLVKFGLNLNQPHSARKPRPSFRELRNTISVLLDEELIYDSLEKRKALESIKDNRHALFIIARECDTIAAMLALDLLKPTVEDLTYLAISASSKEVRDLAYKLVLESGDEKAIDAVVNPQKRRSHRRIPAERVLLDELSADRATRRVV